MQAQKMSSQFRLIIWNGRKMVVIAWQASICVDHSLRLCTDPASSARTRKQTNKAQDLQLSTGPYVIRRCSRCRSLRDGLTAAAGPCAWQL